MKSTPRSPVLSNYSRGLTLSKMSLATNSKRDLSQLSAQNFKVLSMRSRLNSQGQANSVNKKTIQSQYIPEDARSGIQKSVSPSENVGKEDSSDALRRQNSFISIINESPASKIQRTKTKHSSYFEALMPKYKHLSKFANEDYGTFNLVKIIEQQVLYGEGIKTQRLINGRIENVLEENYSALLVREIEMPSIDLTEGRRNVAKHKEEEYRILKARLKTKKDLSKLIEESPFPLSMSIIKAFTIICIVLLTILLIADYLYTEYRLADILSATDMLGYVFKLRESFLNLWYNAKEIFLVLGANYNIYQSLYPVASVYISILQNQLDSTGFDAHLLVDEIAAYPTSISNANIASMINPITPMYLYTLSNNSINTTYTSRNYSIFQAAQIVLNIIT